MNGTTRFEKSWETKKIRIARQRAKSLVAWYRWQYNIAPKTYPFISIYEIELELEAKKRASDTKGMVDTGQEFYDSELEPEEMEDELSRLMSLEASTMEKVSLDEALNQLG